MAGSHTTKTSIKHRTTVPDMDTSRKEEMREAKLAKRPRNRCEVDRTNIGAVRTLHSILYMITFYTLLYSLFCICHIFGTSKFYL
jgi:hypothetical protein